MLMQSKYDDPAVYERYSGGEELQRGLESTGGWHEMEKLLPDFQGSWVLDLGCGLGWHCLYAAGQGAARVVGVDISARMLEQARTQTDSPAVEFVRMPIEEYSAVPGSFDVVLSSMAFQHVADFEDICRKVYRWLGPGGRFVFSVEHPIVTAQEGQGWHDDEQGNHLHWPVDHYFTEGRREANAGNEEAVKYHRTLTGYLDTLLLTGFYLAAVVEPQPDHDKLHTVPGLQDELRRPQTLLVSAVKP